MLLRHTAVCIPSMTKKASSFEADVLAAESKEEFASKVRPGCSAAPIVACKPTVAGFLQLASACFVALLNPAPEPSGNPRPWTWSLQPKLSSKIKGCRVAAQEAPAGKPQAGCLR